MPDALQRFIRWLIEQSLGPGAIPDTLSIREQFLGSAINRLLFPKDFTDVMTSENFGYILKAVLFIATVMWIIELVTRLIYSIKTKDFGYHITQWFYSGFILAGASLAIVPTFISIRWGFDVVGRWLAVLFIGTNDSDEFIRRVLALSDSAVLNAVLTVIQAILLLLLMFWVIIIPFALWVSVFFLIIGISFRFVPAIGPMFFRASVNFTVIAFIGNSTMLVIIAAFVGGGRAAFPNDTQAQAILNTVGILTAIFVAWLLLHSFKGRIKAAIDRTVEVAGDVRGRMDGGRSGPRTINKDQADQEAQRSKTEGARQSTKSTYAKQQDGGKTSPATDIVSSDPEQQATKTPHRRTSSTAARSQRGVTDPEPVAASSGQSQSAKQSARASDRSQKIEVAVDVVSTGATLAGHPEVAMAAQVAKPVITQKLGGSSSSTASVQTQTTTDSSRG